MNNANMSLHNVKDTTISSTCEVLSNGDVYWANVLKIKDKNGEEFTINMYSEFQLFVVND
jgi:hypothetical protein